MVLDARSPFHFRKLGNGRRQRLTANWLSAVACMLALLTVASLLPAHAIAQQPPPPYGRNHRRESQREVEAIEQQLRQAELHGDAATLDRYLADD